MNIFQKAGELADEWDEYHKNIVAGNAMADLLRTIAAMGGAVEVEPVAYLIYPPKKPSVGRLSKAMDRTATEKGKGFMCDKLYDHNQLAAATVQAHEAGRRAGLEGAKDLRNRLVVEDSPVPPPPLDY